MLFAGLALAAGSAGAEVFKWVDEQGRVHFGGTPPAGRKAEKLNVQSSPVPAAAGTSAKTWQEQLQLSNERRQLARDKEQAAAKSRAADEQRCLEAQRALDTLNRQRPIYRVDSQGQREYMDDAQRQASYDAVNQRIQTYCR